MAGFGVGWAKRRFRTSYTSRESGRHRTGITCMVNLENKEENNEEGTLGSATRHTAFTRHGTMISDDKTPVSEVGDDEPEGTSGDVEVRQNGDNLVMRHPIKSFTEVNSGSNDS